MEQLRLQAADWGLELDCSQISLLSRYGDLLAKYALANVIGTKNRDKIILAHLMDALSCFVVKDLRRATYIIDVGTGAGLPGIPLAIAQSGLRIALLEATEKKVRFLEYARTMLGLPSLEVLHARAENVGKRSQYRETFDLATARALAALPVVVEYCAPLVRPGGGILAMKGRLLEEELTKGMKASRQLGVALRQVRDVKYRAQLPQNERHILVFDKIDVIPDTFPRRMGLAKKRPLGD